MSGSGAYRPLAPFTDNDHGVINTMTSIILIVITATFLWIRYVISQKKLLGFEVDDGVFAFGAVMATIFSILSQRMVPSGLGRHRDTLSTPDLQRFYKLHYANHSLAIISMTCSKVSLTLLYSRIVPKQMASTLKTLLLPCVLAYCVVSLLLVAFQCQLPDPWKLQPAGCSSHGSVHYATSALNILTDILLAFWIVPVIWRLQTASGTRAVVISLLASRVIVCLVDCGRMYYIHYGLRSEDTTWSFLLWAMFDQLVVHFSLNHATLPRIHIFLRELQTGTMATRLPAAVGNSVNVSSGFSSSKTTAEQKSVDSQFKSVELTERRTWKAGKFNPFKSGHSKNMVSLHEEPHSSRTQLRLEPDNGNEISVSITSGDADSTSSSGRQAGGKVRGEAGYEQFGNGERAIDQVGEATDGQIKVQVEHTVEIRTRLCNDQTA